MELILDKLTVVLMQVTEYTYISGTCLAEKKVYESNLVLPKNAIMKYASKTGSKTRVMLCQNPFATNGTGS